MVDLAIPKQLSITPKAPYVVCAHLESTERSCLRATRTIISGTTWGWGYRGLEWDKYLLYVYIYIYNIICIKIYIYLSTRYITNNMFSCSGFFQIWGIHLHVSTRSECCALAFFMKFPTCFWCYALDFPMQLPTSKPLMLCFFLKKLGFSCRSCEKRPGRTQLVFEHNYL